jgi:membrane protease YdiL (CAAX protease family)
MLQHLLFLFLLIGVPAWDLIETRRLKASRDPKAKLQSYNLTIAILWATALLCFVARGHALFAAPLSPAQVKWLPSGEAAKAASLGFLVAVSVGLALPAVMAAFSPKVRDRLLAQFDTIDFFLPRTTEELRWFVLVCITAGVCEEVLYRGFLIAYLAVWPLKASGLTAILFSSLMFGTAHLYQGVKGIVVTGIVGLVMAILFLWTGNLILPMVFHTLIDLRAWFILRLRPRDVIAAG